VYLISWIVEQLSTNTTFDCALPYCSETTCTGWYGENRPSVLFFERLIVYIASGVDKHTCTYAYLRYNIYSYVIYGIYVCMHNSCNICNIHMYTYYVVSTGTYVYIIHIAYHLVLFMYVYFFMIWSLFLYVVRMARTSSLDTESIVLVSRNKRR